MSGRAGGPVESVVERLCRQAAGQGVGVIDLVVLVPAVGDDRLLVDPRLADGEEHVLDIETALHEIRGQPFEQLGIGRRVAGTDIIQRLGDAYPPEITPHTVYIAFGEE